MLFEKRDKDTGQSEAAEKNEAKQGKEEVIHNHLTSPRLVKVAAQREPVQRDGTHYIEDKVSDNPEVHENPDLACWMQI